ncbi:DUF3429 domain-containing protein [Sphingorhabdus arenilitoris]|uniref:DUF3429 domain-containing protein n=1 Tax=Sphingorhabdus arenilitoris TaxID=1490041 RepID=A0ABV8RG87_9SPHN
MMTDGSLAGGGRITILAKLLGYAGLLPQLFCVVALLSNSQNSWFALSIGFGYAALIFSFLGGIWWGQAVATGDARPLPYIAAVLPSLISLAAYLPWTLGWGWPGPSLIIIGLCLIASPAADRQLFGINGDWMTLRWHLSLGLGVMTVFLGVFAEV